jgi:hypothetical protein
MRKLAKIGINSHNSSFQTSSPKYILVYGFDDGESVMSLSTDTTKETIIIHGIARQIDIDQLFDVLDLDPEEREYYRLMLC